MSARLESGVPFGRYVLLKRLAVGGMAEIWLARPLEGGGKPVVLKRILPQFASDPDFLQRFSEEASLTLQLVHGNVVPVFEIGRVGEDPYIAMEWVPGRDLRSILRRARERGTTAPPGVAAYLAAELLRGLDYAHRKSDETGTPLKLVHRDVSPSNVVVSNEGTVKLLDFGIAKAIGRAEATRTGVLRGKVGYMSPEQARGETVGPQSDLFSTGVVLYELLTAEKLFDGESEPEILERVKSAAIPRVREKNADVPIELDRILARALERDPALRYASAGEFLADLSRFLYGEGVRGDAAATTELVKKLFPEDFNGDAGDVDERTSTRNIAGMSPTPTLSQLPPGPALVLGGNAALHPARARRPPIALAVGLVAGAIALAGGGALLADAFRGENTTPTAGGAGFVYVETSEPGAEVWIDGRQTGKRTPVMIDVDAGRRVVAVKHPDHREWSTEAEVRPGQTEKIIATLVPDLRKITVDSVPSNALLTGPGGQRCVAPCSFEALRPSQTVEISATLAGYEKASVPVRVADVRETVTIRLAAARGSVTGTKTPVAVATAAPAGTGTLSFRVFPGWAFLRVDDRPEQTKPIVDLELPAGPHRLHIRTEDGTVKLECSVVIQSGRELKLKPLDVMRPSPRCPDVES